MGVMISVGGICIILLWIITSPLIWIHARLIYGKYTWTQFFLSKGALSSDKLCIDVTTRKVLPSSAQHQRGGWYHYPSFNKEEWFSIWSCVLFPFYSMNMYREWWTFIEDPNARDVSKLIIINSWTLTYLYSSLLIPTLFVLYYEMGTKISRHIATLSIIPAVCFVRMYWYPWSLTWIMSVSLCHAIHPKITWPERKILAIIVGCPYIISFCLYMFHYYCAKKEEGEEGGGDNNNKMIWTLIMIVFLIFMMIQWYFVVHLHERVGGIHNTRDWNPSFHANDQNKKTDANTLHNDLLVV